MSALLQDVRSGVRSLRRAPGFTAVAVLTLALGIGATTGIFGMVNAVLLRPLAFAAPDRIVSVYQIIPRPRVGTPLRGGLTPDQLQIWRDRATAVTEVAAWGPRSLTLTDAGDAIRLNGASVTAGFFPLLGVAPLVGRTFGAEDERPGAEPVVVLAHDTWTQTLATDTTVIGRLLVLDDEPFRVVGVMPPVFRFPSLGEGYRDASGRLANAPQFWVPQHLSPPNRVPGRDVALAPTLARVSADVSMAQATSEGATLIPPIRDDWQMRIDLVSLEEEMTAPVRPALLALQAAVGFLLLIACANVTNLLLVRGAAHQRELAVRVALGGGRTSIVRAVLAESLLLAFAGGLFGMMGVVVGARALQRAPAGLLPRLAETDVDGLVLAFAFGLSLLTGLVVGLVATVRLARLEPAHVLRAASDTDAPGGGDSFARPTHVLAVAQVAAATVLLVGAALLANSFARLSQTDPRFDPDGVLAFELSLETRYPTAAAQQPVYTALLDALHVMPGVESVALGSGLPFQSSGIAGPLVIDGERADPPFVSFRLVAPGYFRSLRVPLHDGRTVTDRDVTGQPAVAVVNAAFVRTYLSARDPLRTPIEFSQMSALDIVGVVGDVGRANPVADVIPTIYFSYRQLPNPTPRFSPLSRLSTGIRTDGDPRALVPAVRAAVRAMDPGLAIYNMTTLAQLRSDAVAEARFYARAATALAVVALVLAAVGIYSVLSYVVSRRTRELGIRLALGADAASVIRMVALRGTLLAGIGLVIGVAGALAVTRYLASVLVGVSPRDPVTLGAVALVFAVTALVASYLPARRATRVDPAVALRAE